MQYIFKNYKFDANQQVLFQNEQLIELKRNEAKLLNLFLSRPKDILSKETILNEVWGTRIVSEQVVFQNISHLRTVFSNNAIKTFPRKGYQWQLEVQSKPSNELQKPQLQFSPRIVWTLVISVALVLALLFIQITKREQAPAENFNKTNITLIPFEYHPNAQKKSTSLSINETLMTGITRDNIAMSMSPKAISPQSFFNAPYQIWEELQLNNRDLILSGFIYSYQDGLLLRYLLQGENRKWAGYLFAISKETLSQQLHIHLNRVINSQYLSLKDDSLLTAELSLLHSRHPDDHQVLLSLIERQIVQKNYDVAMALVNSLIEQSDAIQHTAYLGSGYMLKGKIYHLRSFLDEAESWYQKAQEVLATRNLLLVQSLVSKNQGWLGYFRKNYGQVKAALYKSASLAKLAGEPLPEIEAYTLLSILSSKLGFDKEKYDYLYKAKSLLLDYRLNKSNFAVIYYHFALFAETQEEANTYFNKILDLPYTHDNSWIIEDTQKHLVQYYIERKAWQQALGLFPNRQTSAFSYNQKAKIYNAMGDQTTALTNAKQAFKLAIVHYKHSEALNAALLLYQISLAAEDITGELEYRTYIKDNAFKQWLERNQEALKALGYFEKQDSP